MLATAAADTAARGGGERESQNVTHDGTQVAILSLSLLCVYCMCSAVTKNKDYGNLFRAFDCGGLYLSN